MKRQVSSLERLPVWARFNGVEFHNAQVKQTSEKGGALFTARSIPPDDASNGELTRLLTVPSDLVLSLERVEEYAKCDRHLREVLEALGEFGKTSRGAILTFLLLQITHSSPEAGQVIGVSNPLTEYVKLLPDHIALPTFWPESERQLLRGTSLEAALEQKMASLEREFDMLEKKTEAVTWCKDVWWGGEENEAALTLEDWKLVDAMYRSRALEMPGIGHAMVPCVDMANHASGEQTAAIYEADGDGNAMLLLRVENGLEDRHEVMITYGDEKGACEMIFSYGFLENTMDDAKALYLDLDIPHDDPLRQVKKLVSKEAPGIKLYTDGPKATWESPLLLWACINEEDGLDFQILQSNDGAKELKVLWKQQEILPEALRETLIQDPMWDVFQLRAAVTIQERIATQLKTLDVTTESFMYSRHQPGVSDSFWRIIGRLRYLEGDLLHKADAALEEQRTELMSSPAVQNYLAWATNCESADFATEDDDFS